MYRLCGRWMEVNRSKLMDHSNDPISEESGFFQGTYFASKISEFNLSFKSN